MIANVNTTVDSQRTVAQIQELLASAKANAIMIELENGQPSSISFRLNVRGSTLSFKLPCNWQGTLAAMKRTNVVARMRNEQQARRVAWRILREWLRAQLSLIESGAATIEEVMLPWAITNDGQTVSQKMLSASSPLLGVKIE